MPKVKLEDGRTATLVYRGTTEDERIESAKHLSNLQQIEGLLANYRVLTGPLQESIRFFQGYVIEIIPEEAPGREDQGRPPEGTTGGQAEQAHDEGAPIPRRRGVR